MFSSYCNEVGQKSELIKSKVMPPRQILQLSLSGPNRMNLTPFIFHTHCIYLFLIQIRAAF